MLAAAAGTRLAFYPATQADSCLPWSARFFTDTALCLILNVWIPHQPAETSYLLPKRLLFLRIYLFLSESQIYMRGGETQRKIFHLLIDFPCGFNGQGWADPKAGASSRSPTGKQDSKAVGCPCVLSQVTRREQEWTWRSHYTNWQPHGILASARGGL